MYKSALNVPVLAESNSSKRSQYIYIYIIHTTLTRRLHIHITSGELWSTGVCFVFMQSSENFHFSIIRWNQPLTEGPYHILVHAQTDRLMHAYARTHTLYRLYIDYIYNILYTGANRSRPTLSFQYLMTTVFFTRIIQCEINRNAPFHNRLWL